MGGIGSNIYVAVIDDDDSVCRSLARLLRASQIHAITYGSAESFMTDQNRPRFDCLLLDIRLGGVSGTELQQKLADAGDHTPVIFITAHDEPEARQQAERAGCIAYFRKTAPGDEVLAAIERAVNMRTTTTTTATTSRP